MDKLDLKTLNIVAQNIQKISENFPGCIIESRGADGGIVKSVDFDQLRQELSSYLVDGVQERYQLNWPGKKESLLNSNLPISKTLRPIKQKSVDFENTKNLFIEGDNLEVLKLLQESYLGKVKIIYIDPPYNTGKDFIYQDNFSEKSEDFLLRSQQVSNLGEQLVANLESSGRFHSAWLSMIYPRLRLARNLLRDDGVIFISIDDNEIHNLRKICDEIFGSDNFIEQFIVRSNPRGNQAKKFVASEHEYILCYSKNITQMSLLGFSKEAGEFNREDEGGIYREIGLRKRGAGSRREDAPNQFYPIYYLESENKITTKKVQDGIEILPKLSDGTDGRWRWAYTTVEENTAKLLARKVRRDGGFEYDIFEKDYFSEDKLTKIKSIFYEKEVNNENGTEELKKLFGGKSFDYPKPVYTIKKLIQSVNDESALILDFFAGSGTTAQAVMEANLEDGGNRRFILVQVPEIFKAGSGLEKLGFSNIAEISAERVRLAGLKVIRDSALMAESVVSDIGFRYLSADSSCINVEQRSPDEINQDMLATLVDNIKPERTADDLLFQVLLDWGLDLSLPVELRKLKGIDTFFVDGNSLIACFHKDGDLNSDLIKEIAGQQPLRAVFRDSGFKDDAMKINIEQIFKSLSPTTEVKTI
jgi:adenine-specific DNA-methyltransferase